METDIRLAQQSQPDTTVLVAGSPDVAVTARAVIKSAGEKWNSSSFTALLNLAFSSIPSGPRNQMEQLAINQQDSVG
jgi:hypothetical protein